MLAKRSLSILKYGIEEGIFSGAGYALVSKRAPGGVGTLGRVSFDPDSLRVERGTLFDIASLTKPLATATAILQLIDREKLSLCASVGAILDAPNLNEITIFQLLTHTSGLPSIPVELGGSVIENAINSTFVSPPGTACLYSDTGYILLGEIVRKMSEKPIDQWFKDEIAKPLYLEHSGFNPDEELVVVETDEDEDPGVAHDPRARLMDGVAGHAGLFASIADVAAYARALLGAGKALMGSETFAKMFENQLDPSIGNQSLGWFCCDNPYMPVISGFSNDSIGHSGFTGCFVLIDRPNQVAACLLTNRVLNQEQDASEFLALRSRWLEASAEDLFG